MESGKAEEPAAYDANVILQYAKGCQVILGTNNKVRLVWDNGAAVEATSGATADYIPPHMHIRMHGVHYAFAEDYRDMVAGRLNAKLAWIICLIRQVVFSLQDVRLSITEVVQVSDASEEAVVSDEVIVMLREKGQVVNSIVNQAFSILALNGITLVSTGHHYSADDKVYTNFMNASKLVDSFESLKIQGWEGTLFHDVMHPFDYDWIAALSMSSDSNVRTKVHGVVAKRFGGMPSGCTVLSLTVALHNEVRVRSVELGALLMPVVTSAKEMIEVIRKKPLDYCASLTRAGTPERLLGVQKFEPAVAIMSSYLKALDVGKLTVLAAKSIKSIQTRNSTSTALGEQAAEVFQPDKVAKPQLIEMLKQALGDLGRDIGGASEEYRAEDPKREDVERAD
jgi:hypothetical protein